MRFTGFTGFTFITLLSLVGTIGWIMNIVRLVDMLPSDTVTLMVVLRCIGIFAAPLGSVLGFIPN